MDATTHWTRAVLLSPPPQGAGTELLANRLKALFAQRDWFAIEQHDPFLALTELCLRERAQISRAAWGLQRVEQIALVIAQPEHWRGVFSVVDLVHAVRRYLPSASIWELNGDETLIPIDEGAATRAGKSPTRNLRLAGEPVHQGFASRSLLQAANHHFGAAAIANGGASHPPNDEGDADSAARGKITRQEIDMLLDLDSPAASTEAAS